MRISKERDLVVYRLWNTGWFKNEGIGLARGLAHPRSATP